MASLTRIAPGVYRIEDEGRQHLVYVAGARGTVSAFWNGEVFDDTPAPADLSGQARPEGVRTLVAPMPATIIKIAGGPGTPFKRGETLVVVEAMKMELPITAEYDGVIKAVHCHEGDLVQAGQPLVELE